MVAGIKGVAFLSPSEVAVTSSTVGEIFVVSLDEAKIIRTVKLPTKRIEALTITSPTDIYVATTRAEISRVAFDS